jgi:pimeloyl-ACP methyl ester carboxylesterase
MLLAVSGLACARTGPISTGAARVRAESTVLYDTARGRRIPVELYFGADARDTPMTEMLVVISGGYGIANVGYSFIANALAGRGYVVASVQHDLPGDEPLARTGNLYEGRRPVWQRGAQNIVFVTSALKAKYGRRLGDKIILIGHSNGGDISMWLANERPELVARAITLDHRRVPIPRVTTPRIMTVRASDTTADPGVLPTADERQALRIEVVTIAGAKHNDMHDGGSEALKTQIVDNILRFLVSE